MNGALAGMKVKDACKLYMAGIPKCVGYSFNTFCIKEDDVWWAKCVCVRACMCLFDH